MWRKTTEAKPASPASNAPAPGPVADKSKETTPQAGPQQSASLQQAPAAPVAKTQPPVQAPVQTQAKAVSVAPAQAPVPQAAGSGETSTISAGLKIKGDIAGTSDLTVEGETQGKIRITNGRVTVGASGRVTADIDAREIVIHGTVQGNLKATESVRLGSSGRVEGSILTPRIGIDDGARLRGNVEMVRPGEAPAKTDQPKPVTALRAASATASEE
jgi:cytoskeletal protein CcmA (bactofilin family)